MFLRAERKFKCLQIVLSFEVFSKIDLYGSVNQDYVFSLYYPTILQKQATTFVKEEIQKYKEH